jgi:hypothetical protein
VKKGGKVNPVTDWILSDEPTHPAIITPDQFAAAAAVAQHRERSTSGHAPNRHPATRRTYTLRSYVRCTLCGRRMFGKVVNRNTCYACQPPDGRRPDGHPVSVLVPEMPLIGFLGDFLNTRLLGPDRAEHLAATMTDHDTDAGAEPGDPTGLPDEILRGLCEAFRIAISYDRTTRRVRYTAEIEAGTISHLRDRLASPHLQICDVPPGGARTVLRRQIRLDSQIEVP